MTRKRRSLVSILAAVAALLLAAATSSAQVYVSTTGNNADGNSWATAYTDVQTAINDAVSEGESVWIAEGSYLLAAPLTAQINTRLYGGFPATGNPGMPERDPATHPTVLDGQHAAPHLIVANGAYGVRLDGLTLQGGNALGASPDNSGGAVSMRQSSMVIIVDCTITGNQAQSQGGGIFCDNSQLNMATTTIEGNSAAEGGGVFGGTATLMFQRVALLNNESQQEGGGLAAYESSVTMGDQCLVKGNTSNAFGGGLESHEGSLLALSDSEVSGNTAALEGGGIKLHSMQNVTVERTVLRNNSAASLGGGIGCYSSPLLVSKCIITGNQGGRGGGIECHEGNSLQVVNSMIAGNSATGTGGGINLDYETATVSFCTVADNSSGEQGGGLFGSNGTTTVAECVFWGNSPDQVTGANAVNWSDVQGGAEGTGNLDADPMFVDPAAGDYHLRYGSPCIDAAPSIDAPMGDFEGGARPIDYPGLGIIGVINSSDMGADEAFPGPPAPPLEPGASAISTDSILWTWKDDSLDESAFALWADAGAQAPTTSRGTTEANATSWQMDGLAANTLYSFQVAAVGVYGTSAKTALYSAWTLARLPRGPIVGNPTLHSLSLAVAPDDGNPSGTEYALWCATLHQWVQPDGTLGDAQAFHTAPDWGTTVLSGLTPGTSYAFQISARNGAGALTAAVENSAFTHLSVPDVGGLAQTAAEAALTGAGLTVGTVTEAHNATVLPGAVVSQDPPAGAEAVHGDGINLTVSLGPLPVAVPNVTGLPLAGAQATLTGAGLAVGPLTYVHSDSVAAGLVLIQAPPAGTEVAPGSPISLEISLGPEPVTVPNLLGVPRSQAEAAITGAGLVVGTVTEVHSDSVAAGAILSQDPQAGTELPPGSAVNLVVSIGPVPAEGEQPPVDADQARQTLNDGFAAADANGDGKLSFDEASAAVAGLTREVFDELDANQDGLLATDELQGQPGGCAGLQCNKATSFGAAPEKGRGGLLTVLLSLLGLAALAGLSQT